MLVRALTRAVLVALVCLSPVRLARGGTLSPDVVNGVSWLKQQIQSNGSLAGEGTPIATPPNRPTSITLWLLGTK